MFLDCFGISEPDISGRLIHSPWPFRSVELNQMVFFSGSHPLLIIFSLLLGYSARDMLPLGFFASLSRREVLLGNPNSLEKMWRHSRYLLKKRSRRLDVHPLYHPERSLVSSVRLISFLALSAFTNKMQISE